MTSDTKPSGSSRNSGGIACGAHKRRNDADRMRLRQPLRRLQLPQFAGGGQAVARFGLHRRRAVGQHDVEPPTRWPRPALPRTPPASTATVWRMPPPWARMSMYDAPGQTHAQLKFARSRMDHVGMGIHEARHDRLARSVDDDRGVVHRHPPAHRLRLAHRDDASVARRPRRRFARRRCPPSPPRAWAPRCRPRR